MFRTYQIPRTCGRCNGSGKGACRPTCHVCDGTGSKVFDLYGHELTEKELTALPNHLRLAAIGDAANLQHQNRLNRLASEKSRWEDEVKTWKVKTSKGNSEVPIGEKRIIRRMPNMPIGSTDPKKWEKALQAEERVEKVNGDELVYGTRSCGIKAQRAVG